MRAVTSPKAGAVVTFLGTVRNSSDGMLVRSIDVESARELALADLRRIGRRAIDKFEVTSISISHRVGRLHVGEIIVAIAVSAPHRRDAFSACKFVIDELKKTTPIWKKEFGTRKGRWIKQEI